MARPQEDLALIRQLMEESHRAVRENGKHFLVWGVLAAVGLFGTYFAIIGRIPLDPRWLWGGLLLIGWTASMWIGYRDAALERVRTTGRRLLSVLWFSTGITLTLIAVAGLFGGAVPPSALSGLVAVVIGLGFLCTGVLTGQRWLGWVAVAWWVGGTGMLFRPGLYTLALLGTMVVLFEVVPGAVLYRNARRG